MIGKDPPGDFDLDIDFDGDFDDEDPEADLAPSAVSSPPPAHSRPTPRGIGPPPIAPPPVRNQSGVRRYRAAGQVPPRRPTRIPGVPLTEAETAQVRPADIDPEDLENIFGTADPLAYGTELSASDVPETSLDDGFDPWGDLSEDDEDIIAAEQVGEARQRASDALQTPVVGIRDQLDAEAAVPEFEDLADLGFSARPVTIQQLNLADPSWSGDVEDESTKYVSFDDLSVEDDATTPAMPDEEEPSDYINLDDLPELDLHADDVHANQTGPAHRALDQLLADPAPGDALPASDHSQFDFSIDVDELATQQNDAPTVDMSDSDVGLGQVSDLGDAELDFESAADSREIMRVRVPEGAFDDDGDDEFDLADDPDADALEDDDEMFGDDPDDIGFDLHLPEWSPLIGDQATAAVNSVDGVAALLLQASALLDRSRAQDADDLLNAALAQEPNHPEAALLKEQAAQRLDELAFEALGDLDGFPKLNIHPNEIVGLQIDSKGAYLLMQIDGEMTTADLLELSPMGHAATARLLARFLADEVIVVLPPEDWAPRRGR